jgi:hypothetical protein
LFLAGSMAGRAVVLRGLLYDVRLLMLFGSPLAALGGVLGWTELRFDRGRAWWVFPLGGGVLGLFVGATSTGIPAKVALAGAIGGAGFWLFAAILRPAYSGVSCAIAVALFFLPTYLQRVPDLSEADAAAILSGAPEFRSCGRLLKVANVHHMTKSMDSVSYGDFTLQKSDTAAVQGRGDFRYQRGRWYLNVFWYGCPNDCRTVDVHDGPDKQTGR